MAGHWPTETDSAKHERQHTLISHAATMYKAAMEAQAGSRRKFYEQLHRRMTQHLQECHGLYHVAGLPPTVREMHEMHVADHQLANQ